MTEPLVNTSIRAFGQLEFGGKYDEHGPACPSRAFVKNVDWGASQTAPHGPSGLQSNKNNKYSDDIQSPIKQMGISPQYMISLPCVEVNELANKRIHQGRGALFNGQLTVAKPTTGMDAINFEPSQRIGRVGMDSSQRPFTFGSFQYVC